MFAAMGKGRLLPLELPRHARFRTRPLVVRQRLVGRCGPAGLAGTKPTLGKDAYFPFGADRNISYARFPDSVV